MPRPEIIINPVDLTTKVQAEAAVPGSKIRLMTGDHILGNAKIKLQANVELVSADEDLFGTRILSTANMNSMGAIVSPGDHCRLADFSIIPNGDNLFQIPLGLAEGDAGGTDVLVERLLIKGDTDGVYLNANTLNPIRWTIHDTIIRTLYDCVACFGSSGSGWENFYGELTMINCDLLSKGPSIAAPTDAKARAVIVDAFTVRLHKCRCQAGGASGGGVGNPLSNSTLEADGVDNSTAVTLIEAHQCELYAFGAGAKTANVLNGGVIRIDDDTQAQPPIDITANITRFPGIVLPNWKGSGSPIAVR